MLTRNQRILTIALVVLAVISAVGTIAVTVHLARQRPAPPPSVSAVATVLGEDQAARAGNDDRVPTGTPTAEHARRQLAMLPVAAPILSPAYDRRAFGTAWADGQGCDTRDDVLADWVTAPVLSGPCDVVGGSLYDVYTATTLSSPRQADIDHVVSLGDAWRSGAATWDRASRQRFATDRMHLIPVAASANRAKGDKPPDRWLPPSAEYHCEYARIIIGTKSSWRLTITEPEHAALTRALDTC